MRTAIFIDLSNLFYAAREQSIEVDYGRLLETLTGSRHLVRAYAYTGLDPENETQKAFHSRLRGHGYTVVVKEVRRFADGAMKANLDIEIAVDLLRLAPKIDVAVVLSGDGDFAPAIRAVQDMGVRVEVAGFRKKTSLDLHAVADVFRELAPLCSPSGRPARIAGRRATATAAAPAKQVEAPAGTRGRGRRATATTTTTRPARAASRPAGGARPSTPGTARPAARGRRRSRPEAA